MLFLIGVVFFVAANFTLLTASSKNVLPDTGIERLTVSFVSPFQRFFSNTIGFAEDIWDGYFYTVRAARENPALRKALGNALEAQNRCRELELENDRLRKFIDFQNSENEVLVAAKVIGRSPSPWFKTIMIDKGAKDGLAKGLPVMVSEGVVGQIVSVADRYSKVLLVTDRNSAVDALVQNSRVRGIVKGNNTEQCSFDYVLRKDDILPGDLIVSSGLDGVFSKGLRIGEVVDVTRENSALFQTIVIKTSVRFDRLEEVLVSVKKNASGEDA